MASLEEKSDMGTIGDDETMSQLAEQANDAQLFEHNRRFQAAVLRTMEKQIAQMEEITHNKELELAGSERVREDLALSWAEMKKELTRLNKSYEKTATDLRKSQHDQATLTNENLHLKLELTAQQKSCQDLEGEVQRLRYDISTTREELHAGKKLHQLFNSEITMHRQLKENLGSEIRNLQTELKKSVSAQEELTKKWEKSQSELHHSRSEFQSQCDETRKAQQEVERVVHELGLLKAARDVMARQWEDALGAMHKRDQTMVQVGTAKQQAEGELAALKNTEQSLSQEVYQLRKANELAQQQFSELTDKYDELHRQHKELLNTHTHHTKEQDLLSQDKTLVETEANTLKRQNQLLRDENERLKLRTNQAMDKAAYAKMKFEEEKDLNTRISQSIASVENTSLATTETENTSLKQRIIALEYSKQIETNKSIELIEQLKDFSKKNDMLNSEYKEMNKNYDIIVGDMKQLQIQLDHMTYRANKAESEALALRTVKEAERRSEALSVRSHLHNLEKELEVKSEEVAKMNHAYVVAEEKVLEAQRAHNDILSKTERLKAELKKAEGVKDRLKMTIDTLGKENITILKENNEQRLTNRKHQELLNTLTTENEALKSQVAEARFKASEKAEVYEGEITLLRTELVRSKTLRQGATEVLESSEREKGLWERKFEHEKMRYKSLKDEYDRLSVLYLEGQKQVKSLQREQSLQEKQYSGWMKNFELMFEKQNAKKRSAGLNAPTGPPKLTFSSSQQLSTKQVLDNFHATMAGLPPTSATFLTSNNNGNSNATLNKAGASIMGTGSAVPPLSSSPALDSLNEMMQLMSKSGVVMQPTNTGSMSARTLLDSASSSSLLNRESGGAVGHGKRNNSFTENLVHELRQALHKSSTAAADRQNEIVRLKQELKNLLAESNETAQREGTLLQRVHYLSTQLQSVNMNLHLTQQAYRKAESLSASLEKQLRAAYQELMSSTNEIKPTSSSTRPDSDSSRQPNSSNIRTIDYQYYPDLEPSPLLRSILNTSTGTNASASTISLGSYGSSSLLSPQPSSANFFGSGSTSSLDEPTEEKSLTTKSGGRTGRLQAGLGLGRPSNLKKGDTSTSSLTSQPGPSPSIASTASLLPSNQQSMAQLHSYQLGTATSSSSTLRPGISQSSMFSPSASSATLDLPNQASSNVNSFANLPIPIAVKPSGSGTTQ